MRLGRNDIQKLDDDAFGSLEKVNEPQFFLVWMAKITYELFKI